MASNRFQLFWLLSSLFAAPTFGQFLENTVCHDARDCYIREGELTLSCWYNVNKCRCRNTFSSIYTLKYEGNECLMSKYGPCGVSPTNPTVRVGCADGFACIDNRCRDPNDPSKTVKSAYQFPTGTCKACDFSQDLQLQCEGWNVGKEYCVCKKIYLADGRGTTWDLRNYDGHRNCSVGRYGPCGSRNGVTIECHGDGIECVDGLCINPEHPKSANGEVCQKTENCEVGLICSDHSVCIPPKSSPEGTDCRSDEECMVGLKCWMDPKFGPWSSPRCTKQ